MTRDLEKKLNITMVDKDELRQVCKDRLDFGFDSIYFRYASVIDELSRHKMLEPTCHRNDKDYWEKWANNQKMHFYMVLEQLTHAHEEVKDDTDH